MILNAPTPSQARHLRLGVLLSGSGRTLLNILAKANANELDVSVPVVIASRQCAGAERARNAGLNVQIVPYRSFRCEDGGPADTAGYTEAICDHLDAAKVDLVAQAGFLSLWTIPERYEQRVMNIHPALLPAFGGKGMYGHHVHEAVLAHGCKVSGCTVHFVTNEYDSGPIIIQRPVPVEQGDTPDTLADRVFQQECIAYPEAIRLFAEKRLKVDGRIVSVQK
ncbi:MAG: phosphoribosylglycinamide formyltransferase [Bacteroidetes bacterium]|nr:phosphoribosylglycinamide formyltransferase [Bacteroidota bacterium]